MTAVRCQVKMNLLHLKTWQRYVLEPLSYFTDALTMSLHPWFVHSLIISFKSILLVKPEEGVIVSQIKIKIVTITYLTVTLLGKCSFLDPRFCVQYVMNKDEVIYPLKQEAIATLESANETRVHDTIMGH